MAAAENNPADDAGESATETGPKLIRGQFSRPTLLFKARAPKFSPGKNRECFFLFDFGLVIIDRLE